MTDTNAPTPEPNQGEPTAPRRPAHFGCVSIEDPTNAATRTVIAYTRTADRTNQRSIQTQRDDLDAEVAFRGWTVAEWIDDLGEPGTTLERPGLTRALELLAHHQADALIACDATRLARSAAVTRQLAAHADAYGWRLIVAQDERQLPLFPTEPQGA